MVIVFGAAALRGFTGFGFALAAVPLLGLLLPPVLAVMAVVVLQCLVGLFDLRQVRGDCHWPSAGRLALGAIAGSPAGLLALSLASAPAARIAIGCVTLLAAVSLGRGARFANAPGNLLTLVTGFVAGLFNGLAAMPGPPVVAYYLAMPLTRRQVRASLLVFFLSTSVVAFVSALWFGLIESQAVVLALAGLPLMIAGTLAGEAAARFGSDRLHRMIAVVLLALIGLSSAGRGLLEILAARL